MSISTSYSAQPPLTNGQLDEFLHANPELNKLVKDNPWMNNVLLNSAQPPASGQDGNPQPNGSSTNGGPAFYEALI